MNDNQPFSPFINLEGAADCGLVLVCDHASNVVPHEYGTLGLPKDELFRHIAYDIGAAGVVTRISDILGAPAVLSQFSRLLIDPNRAEDDPTLIMQISDGAVIPGNAKIDARERQKRLSGYYQPYHRAIDRAIDRAIAADRPPVVISIHSFTQEWRGALRPWEAGVLWDEDARFVKPLLECLRRETDFNIGDNQPYTGKLKGDCMYQHGTCRGIAHALIEIRQDQIRDKEGQAEWAGRLADILKRILADEELAQSLAMIRPPA